MESLFKYNQGVRLKHARSQAVSAEKLTDYNHSHKVCFSRSMVAYFAHYYGQHSFTDIAYYFSLNPNTLRQNRHRHVSSRKNTHESRLMLEKIKTVDVTL